MKQRPDEHDPDAQGLPPEIKLPDRAEYRYGAIKAMTTTNALSLLVIVGLLLFEPRYPLVLQGCAAVVALFFAFNVYRLFVARRALRERRE